jgi:hypothetical protein
VAADVEPFDAFVVDLPPLRVVAAPMSDSGPTCPHCGLPLSAMQVAALVSVLGVRTRKRRSLAAPHGMQKLLVPYPQLMHPSRLVRLPKV